jgi:hypothetical protein
VLLLLLLLLRRRLLRRQIYIHCTIGLARIYSRMGRHAAALSLLRATGYEYRRLHSQGLVSAAVVSAVFSHNSAQLATMEAAQQQPHAGEAWQALSTAVEFDVSEKSYGCG